MPPELLSFVTCLVAGRRLGVPASAIVTILRAVTITVLPDVSTVISGVINVHERIVPVLCMRVRFGMPARAVIPDDRILVVETGTRCLALLVDSVEGFSSIPSDQLVSIRMLVPRAQHMKGVVRSPEGLVLIHDLNAFLTEAEAVRLDGVLSMMVQELS